MWQIEVADLNFDRISEERRPEAGIFQRDIGVADAADRAHGGGVASAHEIILELIFPDAAQPAFDLKTRLGEVRRLGKTLFGHGRPAAVHINAAAQVEAVGMVQQFHGKTMAQIDKERKRRTFGAVFRDKAGIAAAANDAVCLSAQFLFLVLLLGDFFLELLQALGQRRDFFDLLLEKTNFLGRVVRQRRRRRRRENNKRQGQKRCLPGPKLRLHLSCSPIKSWPCDHENSPADPSSGARCCFTIRAKKR